MMGRTKHESLTVLTLELLGAKPRFECETYRSSTPLTMGKRCSLGLDQGAGRLFEG